MKNPNTHLTHFSYLFLVIADCGKDALRSSANSPVFLCGLNSTNLLKDS